MFIKLKKVINYTLVFVLAFSFLSITPSKVKPAKAAAATNINLGWLSKTPVIGEAYWTDISDDGHYAYVTSSTGLQIVDITNPAMPLVKSAIEASTLFDVTSVGNYVYFGSGKTLKIADVSDPAKPFITSTLDMPDTAQGVFVFGNLTYVACNSKGLTVVDITSPYAPVILQTIDTDGYSSSVAVSNNVAVVADSSATVMIDVADPTDLSILSSLPSNYLIKDVAIDNNIAYVAASEYGLLPIDINDPRNPQALTAAAPTPYSSTMGIAISNNKAYASVISQLISDQTQGMQVFNIEPSSTSPLSQTGFVPLNGGYVRGGIAVNQDIAVLCNGTSGIYIIDVSTINPLIKSQTSQTMQSRGLASDQHYLYALSYSSMQQSSLKIFNRDDPKYLKQVGNLKLDVPNDIMLGNDGYAYIVDDKKLKIISISNPANPQVIGTYLLPNTAQGVFFVNNKVYVACWTSGLFIIDVSTKTAPTKLGSLDTPGIAFSVAVSSNTAVVADSDTIRTINVTNPKVPVERSSIAPPNPNQANGQIKDVAIANNVAYATASQLGLFAVNIANPDNLLSIGFGDPPSNLAYASGISIANNKAYVALMSYYSLYNSIQVFDIANPLTVPQNLGYKESPGFYTKTVAVSGRYIYLSDERNIAHVFDTYYDQLKVENTASATTINANQEITYTLKITNPTPYTLTGLNLSSPIPPETTYRSATGGGSFNINKVVWDANDLGPIAPNETKIVTFTVLVN